MLFGSCTIVTRQLKGWNMSTDASDGAILDLAEKFDSEFEALEASTQNEGPRANQAKFNG